MSLSASTFEIHLLKFEHDGSTGTEHYTCIKYDRPNLTSKQITAWQTNQYKEQYTSNNTRRQVQSKGWQPES